ncbi:MAG: luciferase [Frankiales bacterium]|nr:luciferase [Frankiales bacterium]
MKFAVIAPSTTGLTADPSWITAYAQHVEACGFESLVVVEHTVVIRGYESTYPYDPSGQMSIADDCDVPDPLQLLGFLAGQTTTLGLATGVLILPNHHPVPLAKRVATLDALSGGRVRLAVGMGWMQEEIEACGAPFRDRGRRADEQLEVLRKLWTGDAVDHDGEFFSFRGAVCRPARQVPVHVGGHTVAAARRAGRLGDGLQPLGVAGDELRRLVDEMHKAAVDAGRDASALELSLGHLVARVDADKAARLEALGAHRVVLDPSPTTDLSAALDELSACAVRLGLS